MHQAELVYDCYDCTEIRLSVLRLLLCLARGLAGGSQPWGLLDALACPARELLGKGADKSGQDLWMMLCNVAVGYDSGWLCKKKKKKTGEKQGLESKTDPVHFPRLSAPKPPAWRIWFLKGGVGFGMCLRMEMLRLWSSGAPRVGPSIACPFCPILGAKGSCFPHVQSVCVGWKTTAPLGICSGTQMSSGLFPLWRK